MWWMDDKTGCQPEGGAVGCDIDNVDVSTLKGVVALECDSNP